MYSGLIGHFPSTTRSKRMLKKRGIQPHATADNLTTATSSRDSGALSGTLAGCW